MNAEDKNPFARWSRRKQAAREAEAPTPEEAGHVAKAAHEEDTERDDLQSTPAEPDAAEPPEPLPRPEDLTAESDLSPFLRKGVPAALKNTALRKMWSLDPAIRDYVGPAEYAWDFNKPGSMAGFGPLEAGKSVADFLSKVGSFDPRLTAAEPKAAPQQAPPVSSDEEAAVPPQDATASTDRPAEASVPAEPIRPADPPETRQSGLSPNQVADTAAAPADETGPARKSVHSRHGGALPR